MPDFLLEIGCEEIPARMLEAASIELTTRLRSLISRESLLLRPSDQDGGESRLDLSNILLELYATPRRLALVVPGIAAAQPDVTEQVTGPSLKVAFKDGKPTPAAEAFAKRAGVDVSRLQKTSTPKGEYLAATVTRKGRPAAEVLAEAVPKEIAGLYWPKSMYWRAGKPERFVRPVRWMVALLDEEVVPLEYAGIKAGRATRGHRILGPEQVSISTPTRYAQQLRAAHVVGGGPERELRIRKALDAATRTISGARWREDAELLKTVVNLTEWPSVILGNFDPQFLSLPEEVLVTVMRDHQKYFAVENASGKLAPHFLAVLNTDGDPDGLIRHGNERVLRARFNDAQFFWNFDNRTRFADRREKLKHVTFQKDLGDYYEKTERIGRSVGAIAQAFLKSGITVDRGAAVEAAHLSKNDLTAELVKEFTELQGIVGGRYAEHQGLSKAVADAIYDQYKPVSMEDSVPRTMEGAIVAIADKADSIAGMFALGLVPSGSKDPFALRRQANGIVKTIAEHKLLVNLAHLMYEAREQYQSSDAAKKFTATVEGYSRSIAAFFRERLEFYLRDVLGLAYDVVNATLSADANDVVDAVARAQAVAKVRSSPDFESISTSFKRMKNILRQAAEASKRVAEPYSPGALLEESERELAAAIPIVAAKVNQLRASKNYQPALIEISKLRPSIDAFFDKVMVMVEDEKLRANRLGLLATVVGELSSIADFSEIVTERK
ncbi:MAG TPA: glycine--tRNA ligase subunit beta [Terriglobales bacterium]